MYRSTIVEERQCQLLTIVFAGAVHDGSVPTVRQPLQTAVRDVVACRLWRRHGVAVPVLHVAQRHVYIAVVQFGSLLVEIYQYLVAPAYEVELQVRHFLVRHYGRRHRFVDVCQDLVNVVREQVVAYRDACRLVRNRVFLISYVVVSVQIDFLAVNVWCHDNLVHLVTLLVLEA